MMQAPRRARSNGDALALPEIDSVGEIARTCTQSYGIFPNWVSPLSQHEQVIGEEWLDPNDPRVALLD